MKVLFLKDVGGVGRRDEVKDVSDGFAMNSLIPRGQAIQATPERLKEWESRKKVRAASAAEEDAQWANLVRHLHGANITVSARANEQGTLYQQLSMDAIAEGLKHEYGVDVPPDALALNAPIRSVGESHVELRRGEHRARFMVTVVKAV